MCLGIGILILSIEFFSCSLYIRLGWIFCLCFGMFCSVVEVIIGMLFSSVLFIDFIDVSGKFGIVLF